MDTSTRFSRFRKIDHTAEGGVLRAATLTMACSWPLWMLSIIQNFYPGLSWLHQWFPLSTLALFSAGWLAMAVSWVSGRNEWLILANRMAGITVPFALILVFFQLAQNDGALAQGIWFTYCIGIPAVAFVLSVPPRISIPWYVLTVGGTTLLSALVQGRRDWIDLFGWVGFGLINGFMFIVVAAVSRPVAQLVDWTEQRTREDQGRVAKLRVLSDEIVRFTGLIHDYVLADLAAISRGEKPSGQVDLLFGSEGSQPSYKAGDEDDLIATISSSVHSEIPHCHIQVNGTPKLGSTELPSTVVANLLLALTEASRNVRKHAGEEVSCTCEIGFSPQWIQVRLRDEGEGFDFDAIAPTRAGLRVSVIGRMSSVKGGSASVQSQLGHGTEVVFEWHGNEDDSVAASDGSSVFDEEPLYTLLGLNIIFSWQFGLAFTIIFGVNLLGTVTMPGLAEFLTFALLVSGMWLLVVSKTDVLSPLLTGFVAVVLIGAFVSGRFQAIEADPQAWDKFMYVSGIVLVLSLLAIRGRPIVALMILLVNGVISEVLDYLDVRQGSGISFLGLLSFSILILAAVFVHVGYRYFWVRLPQARADQRRAARAAMVAEGIKSQRQENFAWLQREIMPVFEATRGIYPFTDRMQKRAHLTELRLRDILRSPLLDRPSLNASIWDARSRGVTVKLLDDRSERESALPFSSRELSKNLRIEEPILKTVCAAVQTLDQCESGDSVTVRLLPSGRGVFATIASDEVFIEIPE